MLVKAIKDIIWGGALRIKHGRYYVVYAIEQMNEGKSDFYVYSLGQSNEDESYNPLPFDSQSFETIDGSTPSNWITQVIVSNGTASTHTSFPEWFDNYFWARAHDWDLYGDDYKIIKKYKDLYEEPYSKYLPLQEAANEHSSIADEDLTYTELQLLHQAVLRHMPDGHRLLEGRDVRKLTNEERLELRRAISSEVHDRYTAANKIPDARHKEFELIYAKLVQMDH